MHASESSHACSCFFEFIRALHDLWFQPSSTTLNLWIPLACCLFQDMKLHHGRTSCLEQPRPEGWRRLGGRLRALRYQLDTASGRLWSSTRMGTGTILYYLPFFICRDSCCANSFRTEVRPATLKRRNKVARDLRSTSSQHTFSASCVASLQLGRLCPDLHRGAPSDARAVQHLALLVLVS